VGGKKRKEKDITLCFVAQGRKRRGKKRKNTSRARVLDFQGINTRAVKGEKRGKKGKSTNGINSYEGEEKRKKGKRGKKEEGRGGKAPATFAQ